MHTRQSAEIEGGGRIRTTFSHTTGRRHPRRDTVCTVSMPSVRKPNGRPTRDELKNDNCGTKSSVCEGLAYHVRLLAARSDLQLEMGLTLRNLYALCVFLCMYLWELGIGGG